MGGIRRIAATSVLVVVVVAALLGSAPSVASAATPPAGQAAPVKASAATPKSVPQVPFIEGVIAEGLGVLVNWNPDPTSNDVTKYKLVATVASGFTGTVSNTCKAPPAASAPGTDTSALISSLCAGIPYSISLSAANAKGTSAASPKSNPVVPLVAQKPSAPLITSVLPRSGSLIVDWSAPSITGGDPLTGYSLTATAGTKKVTMTAGATLTQLTLTKLTNGTAYTLTLVATTKAGNSVPGTSTGTPSATAKPEAPQSLQVTPNGHGDLVATWSAPANPGTDAVAHYTVTAQPEAETNGVWSATGTKTTKTVGASTTTDTITGLSKTAFYAVSVAASSSAGTGPAVTTTNPVTTTVQLASSTIVLTQATMNALSSDSTGTLTWPSPAPSQVSSLVAGDVLIGPISAAAPNGLLGTVSTVTDTSGTYTITTTTASLSDAFSNLSFGISGDPVALTGSSFQARTAGVRTLHPNISHTFSEGKTFSISKGPVSGQINLDASLELSAEVNTDFDIPDGVSLSSSATATATAGLQATLSGSETWPIGELDFTPIDIQAGPVPIILVPQVQLSLTVSGSISVGVEASMTVGAGLSWSSQNPGTLNTKNLTTGPHMDGSGPLPGVSATATGTVELTVQPQIGIYDAAGPNIQADADLTANVNFFGSPYFSLSPSISLKAGLDFDIADDLFHGSLEVTIGTFHFPSFTIAHAPTATLAISPANPTITPGTPTTFTATPSSGSKQAVTWSLAGAASGDKITSSGVLTVVNPPGRSFTVIARYSDGSTGQTTVTVGAGFDPVGDLSAEQASNSLNGSVSWDPPGSTGGSPVASYTITTSDGVPTQSTSGTSASLSNLHPGVTYVITVYPVNAKGVTGPGATTTLYVIPLCTDTFTGGSQGTGTAWGTASNWSGGYVPGEGDWVCDNGNDMTLPVGTTTVEGLQQSGGLTIPSGADLVVSNTYGDSGSLTGPGTLILPASTAATFEGPGLEGGVHVINKGNLQVTGEPVFTESSELENAATISLAANAYLLDDDNSANSLVNDSGATISFNGGSGSQATISVPFTDNGTLTIQSGTLNLYRDTTLSSSSVIGGAGTLLNDGTTLTVPSTATFSGLGELYDESGTLAFPSSSTTLSGVGTYIEAGNISGPGTLILPASTAATFEGPGLEGGVHVINKGNLQVTGEPVFTESSELENAATISLAANAYLLDDDNSANSLVNDSGATISFNGGSGSQATISVPFTDNGTLTIQSGTLNLYRDTTLSSSSVIGGAGTLLNDGTTLTVPSTATFSGLGELYDESGTLAFPSSSTTLSGVGTYIEAGNISGPGTLILPASTAATFEGPGLEGGVHVINKGNLQVTGEPVFTESSELENAATISLAANAYLLDDDNSANSLVNDSGATISFNGGSGSQATISVPFTDNGTLTIQSGTLNLYRDTTLSSSSVIGGAGTLLNDGTTLTVPSTATFSGLGELYDESGTLAFPSSSTTLSGVGTYIEAGNISGPGTLILPASTAATFEGPGLEGGVHVINKGNLQVTGEPVFTESSELENAATISLAANAYLLDDDNSANSLVNDSGATISFNGGSGSQATISVPFTDNGTLTIQSGTLNLYRDTTLSSSSVIGGAGTLLNDGTTLTVPSTATFSGLGELYDESGTLAFPSSSTTLSGVGTYIEAGNISGPGTLILPASTAATFEGPGLEGGVHVINKGNLQVTGEPVFTESSELENAATISLAANAYLLDDDNSANSLVNDSGATISFNGGSGSQATISVPFTDNGTLTIQSGSIYLSSYSPTASAKTAVGVSTSTGQLIVTGTATPKGTLAIATKPGYLPAVGTKVTVLSAQSVTGTFSTVTGTDLTTEHWVVSYTSTSVVLTAASGS